MMEDPIDDERSGLWADLEDDWHENAWGDKLGRSFDRILRAQLAVMLLWYYFDIIALCNGPQSFLAAIVVILSMVASIGGSIVLIRFLMVFVGEFLFGFMDRRRQRHERHRGHDEWRIQHQARVGMPEPASNPVPESEMVELHDGHPNPRSDVTIRDSSDDDDGTEESEREDEVVLLDDQGPDTADDYDSDTLHTPPLDSLVVESDEGPSSIPPVELDLVIDSGSDTDDNHGS